jgi:hypothetical protein
MIRARGWVVALALWSGSNAFGASHSSAAAAPSADPAVVEEAQSRFRRGVKLYEDGDTAGALAELTRAYRLIPNYKILYNLGQIAYQQRDFAAALGYFRRYLSEGDDLILKPRRREVEADIVDLELRTGRIDIESLPAGTTVYLDDVRVGTVPFPLPIAANIGRHRLDAVFDSGQRQSRVVDLAGDETVRVTFERPALARALRVPPPPAPALRQNPAPLTPSFVEARPLESEDKPRRKSARTDHRGSWLSWTVTAGLAVGAGITGGLALELSNQADEVLNTYPASKSNLEGLRGQQRTMAWVSDGFTIGALVMAGVSLYLSLSGASESEAQAGSLSRMDVARAAR